MAVRDDLATLRRRSRGTEKRPAVKLNSLQRVARERVLLAYRDGDLVTEQAACLCGNSAGDPIVDRDRYGLPAPSLLCGDCGVVWATPRLTAESLEAFYEDDYRPLYVGARESPPGFFEGRIARGRALLRFLGGALPENATVVDIGSGAGGVLVPFRDEGHRVAGCDIGSEFLRRGREEGLDLRDGTYRVLEDLAPFGLVILSHVLEHVMDVHGFLAGLEPLMATAGMVYIEVPGLRAIPRSYGDPLRYFQNAHLWNFDLDALTALLARHGWRCVKGDQYIRSLFVRSDDEASAPHSSYRANLDALADAERHRRRYTAIYGVRNSGALRRLRRLGI